MERILEPEVMDSDADAEDYAAMDFSSANRAFVDAALQLLEPSRLPLRVLDIGCGPADIPIALAERRIDVTVVAVDLAESMLRIASRRVQAAGLSDRVKLCRCDAKALGDIGTFDFVMSNSTVHHLPEPERMFCEIARVLKPTGALLVRDLFRPETRQDAWATVERVAPNDSARQKQLFFDSLCAALTLDEVRRCVEHSGLTGTRISVCSDRHWSVERALGLELPADVEFGRAIAK